LATLGLPYDDLIGVELPWIEPIFLSGFDTFHFAAAPAIGFSASLVEVPANAAKFLDFVDPEGQPWLLDDASCFNQIEVEVMQVLIDRETHGDASFPSLACGLCQERNSRYF
jgi:hypothetical protein